jgi:hypothetical protein
VDQPVKMKYFQSPCVVEFTLSPDVLLQYEERTRIR